MGVWPVKIESRDFVMQNYVEKLPDGTLSIVVFTVPEKQNKVPEKKSPIRGSCHIGGWSMEPVEGNKTRLTLVLEIDLKGNLPQTILRQANKDQGF
jgi:hypothetical protein